MNQDQLAALTDGELRAQVQKSKTTKIYDATIIGVLTGIAIYSTFNDGFGLLTFLPVVYLPTAAKNKIKNSVLENFLETRI